MKKLLTLFATLMVAMALSMPAFAQENQGGSAEAAPQSAPAQKHKKKHSKKKKSSKKHKKQKKETPPEAGNQ